MTDTFALPVVQYLRPDGRRKEGHIEVPADVEGKYNLLKERGIEITMEVVFGEVLVCLDDGRFDYNYELWPNDETLVGRIAQLVRDFDSSDYETQQRRKAEELEE